MHFRSIAVAAILVMSVFAREDTSELCTGSLSCDEGYCCSSHGFCGRTSYHCSAATGCNPAKGSCGVVFMDNADMPRVVPYEHIDSDNIKGIAEKLTNEGVKLDPEQAKQNSTLESILHAGAEDKSKYPSSLNKDKEDAEIAKGDNGHSAQSNSTASEHDSTLISESEQPKLPIIAINGASTLASFASPFAVLSMGSFALWAML